MLGVQTLVLEKIRKMERGTIFFIDDFIELGSSGSVRLSLIVKGKVDFPQIGFEKGTTERGVSKVSKSC